MIVAENLASSGTVLSVVTSNPAPSSSNARCINSRSGLSMVCHLLVTLFQSIRIRVGTLKSIMMSCQARISVLIIQPPVTAATLTTGQGSSDDDGGNLEHI